jgi:hypothetical protein
MIMRWGMSDAPPHDEAGQVGAPGEPTCPATLDAAGHKRCQLPPGHDGLHRWRAPNSAQRFEWG